MGAMEEATEQVEHEIRRQIAWLQEALAAVPEGSQEAGNLLRDELNYRLAILALLVPSLPRSRLARA